MKKLFVIVSALFLLGGATHAQVETVEPGTVEPEAGNVGNGDAVSENKAFSHLSAGLGVGTTGIEIQVATPLNDFLALRAGFSFMPAFSYKFHINFDSDEAFLKREDGSGYYDRANGKAKIHMGDLKLLVDAYPFKESSFHVTAGFFIGKSKFITAHTTNHFINEGYWGNSGPELGDLKDPLHPKTYTVVSDNEGAINVDLKVNSFKPYLGIGFGRPIPKSRLDVSFDFGVQFWGKPELWTKMKGNSLEDSGYQKVDRDRIVNTQDYCDDIRDGMKIMEKVIVYPVLTLRLNGRIF